MKERRKGGRKEINETYEWMKPEKLMDSKNGSHERHLKGGLFKMGSKPFSWPWFVLKHQINVERFTGLRGRHKWSEWVSEWMNEWLNEWMNEWNEWNEWMNVWMKEWMNE
jgi:hypothetical protein